jgi:asparagine synthase (glutamine-hydrolysing)
MCGLAGALAFSDTDQDELAASVRQMTSRIVRRGPDDEGFWHDARCALGFRRLAILDLSPAGHQPMTSTDSRFSIVFNGEIYNFREIRSELEALGYRTRSTGDCEVLLHALQAWGTEALRRLNGMFALALYDAEEQSVLLARDHAGIKPLYYAISSRGLVFGSQYDQLVTHPWLRGCAPDPSGLALYLRFGFLPAPFALHRGASQVPAGHWVKLYASGRSDQGCFFQLPAWQRSDLRGDDALHELERALTRALERHLVADVPVGVFLSGGIDSPLVAAEAAKRSPRKLQAFTIGVEDSNLDETAAASRYAASVGLEHVHRRITMPEVLGLFDDVVAACTEPMADYSIFPMLVVSKLAREHVKVVLSGDGGDELYWGYPSRFGAAIRLASYYAWPRPARFAAVAARKWLGIGHATRDVLSFNSLGALYQRKHSLLLPADLDAVLPDAPGLPPSFRAFQSTATDAERAAQWVRWNEFNIHLARVLAKVDRGSMYHSLEVRVPLLDKEIIDVAWRTDWQTCLDLDRRRGKGPLRDALVRRVHAVTDAKRGFTVPMHDWLTGPLRGKVEEELLSRTELLGLPMDKGAARKLYSALLAGDRSKAWGLWLLLSLALWERKHGYA